MIKTNVPGFDGVLLKCDGSLLDENKCYNYINMSNTQECEVEAMRQNWKNLMEKVYCPYCIQDLQIMRDICNKTLKSLGVE